jgi:hypothetical protein
VKPQALLLAALLGLAAAAPAPAPALAQTVYQPPPGQDLMGVWMIEGDHSTLKTVQGRLPPMNRAAKAKYEAAVKARAAGKPIGDTVQQCMPHGLPRLLLASYPIEILQEPTQVTFIHEAQHMPRLVYIGDTLPPVADIDPNWMGQSAGRWDGDTLVVESAGFYDRTTLDRAGLPHSTAMKLTERIRKLDADTLEDVFTVEDPQTYSRPWTARVTYKRRPGYRLQQYVCTLTNPEAQK